MAGPADYKYLQQEVEACRLKWLAEKTFVGDRPDGSFNLYSVTETELQFIDKAFLSMMKTGILIDEHSIWAITDEVTTYVTGKYHQSWIVEKIKV